MDTPKYSIAELLDVLDEVADDIEYIRDMLQDIFFDGTDFPDFDDTEEGDDEQENDEDKPVKDNVEKEVKTESQAEDKKE